jgi:hypothetical protein
MLDDSLKPRLPLGVAESDLECVHLPRVAHFAVHDRSLSLPEGSLDASRLDELGFTCAERGADRAKVCEGKGG